MARLILEEGGQRRAFRVHKGKLTIGSAEGCTLRLTSADVAEQHAELEIGDEGAVLRPRPGVLPPSVGGRAIQGPTRLPARVEVQIGSAKLRLEPEEDEAEKPAAAQGAAAPAASPVVRSSGRAPARAGRAAGGAARERVQLSRPMHKIERGMPTWVIIGILAGIGLVAVVLGKAWIGDEEVRYDPAERLRVAEEAFKIGGLERAKAELDRVDLVAAPQLASAVEAMRAEITKRERAAEVDAWNVEGSKVFDSQIKGFWDKYMQGRDVDRPKARVFIKRCRDFQDTWPQHPELDWVRRYSSRYEELAELTQPPTFEDVAYEIKTLTWAKPRDYERAFAILDEFEAGSGRSAQSEELRTTLETERDEYFTDRMLQAKYHYEKGEHAHSVSELVLLIVMVGDESMTNEAARQLELIPDIESHLRGYQNNRPDRFAQMTKHPLVRDLARSKGVL